MSMVKCILLKIIMWIVIRIDKRLTFSIHIFDEMEHITPDYFHSLTFFLFGHFSYNFSRSFSLISLRLSNYTIFG